MKKIGLVVIMIVLLATVANAASVNGEFEGNPIINVKSNGKTLPVWDVPAILYNGRTMVPIGMLRQLGAEVYWDQKTNSVNVTAGTASDSGYKEKLEKVKFYNEIQYAYGRLELLGDMLASVSDRYSSATQGFHLGRTDSETIDFGNTSFNSVIENYNNEIISVADSNSRLWDEGIQDNGLLDIMKIYFDVIDIYRLADTHFYKYINNKNNVDFELYLDYSNQAFMKSHEGIQEAINKQREYYLKIDNMN